MNYYIDTNNVRCIIKIVQQNAEQKGGQKMTFGEFLNMKRIEAKITIRKFASEVGISPSFLCDLENGNRAFPAKSKKTPDLLEKMIFALNLNENDSKLFKDYAEESMLLGNRLPNEISDYLQRVPEAQQALRLANEKSITNEEWEKFIQILREKK